MAEKQKCAFTCKRNHSKTLFFRLDSFGCASPLEAEFGTKRPNKKRRDVTVQKRTRWGARFSGRRGPVSCNASFHGVQTKKKKSGRLASIASFVLCTPRNIRKANPGSSDEGKIGASRPSHGMSSCLVSSREVSRSSCGGFKMTEWRKLTLAVFERVIMETSGASGKKGGDCVKGRNDRRVEDTIWSGQLLAAVSLMP